uniref:Zinc finger protein 385A n=1 Tax=Terrapene triunguis TaxID=2587831 RepID=A0A674IBX7_9SAUR
IRVAPLPAMLRAPPAMIQPPLDIKHFLPFPMEAQPAVGLFPGFSTVRPWLPSCPALQARVGLCLTSPFPLPLSGQARAGEPPTGARRVVGPARRRLPRGARPRGGAAGVPDAGGSPAPDPPRSPPPSAFIPQGPCPAPQGRSPAPFSGPRSVLPGFPHPPAPLSGLIKGALWGAGWERWLWRGELPPLLPLTVPPPRPGTKHKTILEARSGLGPIKAYPRLGPTASGEPGSQDPNAQERTFHCEICNVKVNSEIQLKQHISSRRHRDGVAGKPNPLLSRHKKQRSSAELGGPLAFPKDLPKSLAAGLLPSPLAMAAAMAAAASAPLTLRPTPPLLQGPPLTHPLLRPAPGPIRTAHGPILFSPY